LNNDSGAADGGDDVHAEDVRGCSPISSDDSTVALSVTPCDITSSVPPSRSASPVSSDCALPVSNCTADEADSADCRDSDSSSESSDEEDNLVGMYCKKSLVLVTCQLTKELC